jgi:hypothetical protein
MSESVFYPKFQLLATELGGRLFRNNVGRLKLPNGKWLAYGVGNPGGSDLIGWMPVVITGEMIGKVFAVFTAAEVKLPHRNPTVSQVRFIEAVKNAGGYAGVVRSDQDLLRIIHGD